MTMTAEALKTYSLRTDGRRLAISDDGQTVTEERGGDAGHQLAMLTREYMAQHPGVTFHQALAMVRTNTVKGQELLRQYAAPRVVAPTVTERTGTSKYSDPGAEIDRRARALLEQKAAPSYSAAVQRVVAEDRELASAYAGRPAMRR
jgi:hypothetical protein